MGDEGEQAPKIIVDSDWKSQARAEKEKLAEQEAKAPPTKGGQEALPPPDFRGLVGMLATQAVMYMGGLADRSTGQAIFDPEYSKHMIDLLGVLEAKTEGNLSDEEAKELGGVLHELRLRFVELSEYVAKGGGKGTPGPGGQAPSDDKGAG
jgi:hypothetical protein